MAGNYTTVYEHKKIAIIPFIKLQVKGMGTLILVLGVHVPLFLLSLLIPTGIGKLFMVLVILSCMGSFAFLENTGRDQEDHVPQAMQFYYKNIKQYKKINADGQIFYLRGKRIFHPSQIERRKTIWKKKLKPL